jgi:hypothetical protein
VLGHQPLERLARVLAAAVGMMQQLSRPAAPPIAITSASVTSSAVIAALIDQPTTLRENRSIETCRLEPIANPFGPKLLPISSV